MPDATRDYDYYKSVLAGRRLPLGFVDLDLFERNRQAVLQRAGVKPVRIASKSIRCVALLERLLRSDARFCGVMCYSPREAAFLASRGFDDLLVAYPAWGPEGLGGVAEATRQGARITLMLDCAEHARHLDAAASAAGCVLPVCLDIDLSLRLPGLHFGVRRSPVATVAQAIRVAAVVEGCRHLRLDGVMGYEAQIAGLPDAIPGRRLLALVVRVLKRRSVRESAARRAQIVGALQARGHALRFVNGGGTGSLETTGVEDCVTELAVGSAFFAPTAFDGYRAFRHLPAAGFALEITRLPAPHIFTCHGGGLVASGSAGKQRLPSPYLPRGARLLADEGAGEVQTPIAYSGPEPLQLGDPILLRHAKSGELCEHFPRLLLISDGRVLGEAATYRGDGQCFP